MQKIVIPEINKPENGVSGSSSRYYQALNEEHDHQNHSDEHDGSRTPTSHDRPRSMSISVWPDHHIQKKLGVFPLAVLTFYAVRTITYIIYI